MNASPERNRALRLLRGLDEGGLDVSECRALAEELDPVLVYVVVRFLREVHPASDPAASPVLERVVRLTSAWPGLVAKSKEGERDPISRWFASEYSFRDFRGRGAELIDLIVEKLES